MPALRPDRGFAFIKRSPWKCLVAVLLLIIQPDFSSLAPTPQNCLNNLLSRAGLERFLGCIVSRCTPKRGYIFLFLSPGGGLQ